MQSIKLAAHDVWWRCARRTLVISKYAGIVTATTMLGLALGAAANGEGGWWEVAMFLMMLAWSAVSEVALLTWFNKERRKREDEG